MPLHTREIEVRRRLVLADEPLLASLQQEGAAILGRLFYRHRVLEMLASYDYDVERTRVEIRREARAIKREGNARQRWIERQQAKLYADPS